MDIEKKLLIRLFLLFIPVSFASYLFHEFGHWIIGKGLGNNMVYTLNLVWPKNGHYVNSSNDLYVSIGGPAFTILLSIVFLLIIEKYNTIYAYPFVFFQMFMRFFAILCGGFSKQDEARISVILGIGTYTVAIIVLLILFLIVVRASYKLRINFRNNCYFLTVSTICDLLVIGTSKMLLY